MGVKVDGRAERVARVVEQAGDVLAVCERAANTDGLGCRGADNLEKLSCHLFFLLHIDLSIST